MRRIDYKYKVGDTVQFKDSFPATASCGLHELAGSIAVIKECRDYAGPSYRLEGFDSFFKESCFVGLVI